MIRPITIYTVICDRCGKDVNQDEEYLGWKDSGYAVECAVDSYEWIELNGKHYCDDCWEWNDEDEVTITSPTSDKTPPQPHDQVDYTQPETSDPACPDT